MHAADVEIERVRGRREEHRPTQELARASYDEPAPKCPAKNPKQPRPARTAIAWAANARSRRTTEKVAAAVAAVAAGVPAARVARATITRARGARR